MNIAKHLNKNNLHHAYLIEGERDSALAQVFEVLKNLGINTVGNPDVLNIFLDNFSIEDARNLKSYAKEKGVDHNKKIFIISANNFLIEAQNSLLKLFEEPIENTHFFIITNDASIFIKTLISRFYFISLNQNSTKTNKEEAVEFISLSAKDRMNFIKKLLNEEDIKDDEPTQIESARSRALYFLNTLETELHNRTLLKTAFDTNTIFFEHIFKVRKFLRQPGSSTKSLMESVALIVPEAFSLTKGY